MQFFFSKYVPGSYKPVCCRVFFFPFPTLLVGLKQWEENKQGKCCVIQPELKLSIFALLIWEGIAKWKKKKKSPLKVIC